MPDEAQELLQDRAKPLKVKGPVLTFAFSQSGSLIHIDDVENGLACKCKCPSCGEPLVARQGEDRAHCFAHQSGAECAGGYETSLHLAAKKIIAEAKCLFLPVLEVTAEATDSSGKKWRTVKNLPAKLVRFNDVVVEESLGQRVPDLVAKVGKKTLAIEVAVTHRCDPTKIADYVRQRCAAVEVNLSDVRSGWGWNSLRKRLLTAPVGGRWLYSPKLDDLTREAEEEAHKLAEQADQRDDELKKKAFKKRHRSTKEKADLRMKAEEERIHTDAQRQARLEQERRDTPGFMDKLKALGAGNLKTAVGPDGPKHVVAGLADNVPEHLNIPVRGEMGFVVDRTVWQSAVFAYFICGKTNESLSVEEVVAWCFSNFEQETQFDVLRNSQQLLSLEEGRQLPSIPHAVQNYIWVLADLGVLKWASGNRYKVARQTPSHVLAAMRRRASL